MSNTQTFTCCCFSMGVFEPLISMEVSAEGRKQSLFPQNTISRALWLIDFNDLSCIHAAMVSIERRRYAIHTWRNYVHSTCNQGIIGLWTWLTISVACKLVWYVGGFKMAAGDLTIFRPVSVGVTNHWFEHLVWAGFSRWHEYWDFDIWTNTSYTSVLLLRAGVNLESKSENMISSHRSRDQDSTLVSSRVDRRAPTHPKVIRGKLCCKVKVQYLYTK